MIPKHLSHKPIVAVDNYNNLDGHYISTDTDVESLSVGYAQFDNTNPDELTAKVFRYDSQHHRWCRQSEELPLHRCVDLCNLIVQSIMLAKGIKYKTSGIKISPLQKDSNNLPIIERYYNNKSNHMQEKLDELKKLLNTLI